MPDFCNLFWLQVQQIIWHNKHDRTHKHDRTLGRSHGAKGNSITVCTVQRTATGVPVMGEFTVKVAFARRGPFLILLQQGPVGEEALSVWLWKVSGTGPNRGSTGSPTGGGGVWGVSISGFASAPPSRASQILKGASLWGCSPKTKVTINKVVLCE